MAEGVALGVADADGTGVGVGDAEGEDDEGPGVGATEAKAAGAPATSETIRVVVAREAVSVRAARPANRPVTAPLWLMRHANTSETYVTQVEKVKIADDFATPSEPRNDLWHD
ncbi:hypothetical protein ACTHRI_04775 [Microbacterium algihabitans]|uniref:hypothetical protein n=1 Tax=Microbacterium algihabitans TaxID=3075992 RepID=UPI003F81B621